MHKLLIGILRCPHFRRLELIIMLIRLYYYVTIIICDKFFNDIHRLAFAALPVGLAYFCVWFVPPLVDQSQFFKYLYYQIVYLLFQASMTVRKLLCIFIEYYLSLQLYAVHPCALHSPHYAYD